MIQLSSSLRERTPEDTLRIVQSLALSRGISRVIDTTWLDIIGVPVFASVRPTAHEASLAVNAGKGTYPCEAAVGAYMEALEFSFAEFAANGVDREVLSVRELLSQSGVDFSFLDLCPVVGVQVSQDSRLDVSSMFDLATGSEVKLPSELIFNPYAENRFSGIFGCSTNGLSSGNSVQEATVHGLYELIERDRQAKNYFGDESSYVDHTKIEDASLRYLIDKIENSGLEVVLRYTQALANTHYFEGFVLEPFDDAPIAISFGSGAHHVPEIGATRALSEAVQSRNSYIHGGRDDLIRRFEHFGTSTGVGAAEARANLEFREKLQARTRETTWDEIRPPHEASNSDGIVESILFGLRGEGISSVFRCVLTPPNYPLAVTRVLAPGLESFQPSLRRVGPAIRNSMVGGCET